MRDQRFGIFRSGFSNHNLHRYYLITTTNGFELKLLLNLMTTSGRLPKNHIMKERVMKNVLILLSVVIAAQAQATEYRAKPVTLKGEISSTYRGMTQNFEAQVPVYRVDTYYVPQQTSCSRVDCSNSSGDGSTGDWKNFYSVSKPQKPTAMAAAIKGIGERTASLIVEQGFFASKPRSWRAFGDEINAAQRRLQSQGYQGQFADLVLGQFGNENARNLGYYVENSCQIVTYPCTILNEVERETFAYNLVRNVEVSSRGAVLQNFERDRYSIRVGFEPGDVQVTPSNDYNTYSVRMTQLSQRDIKIDLVATKRNLVAFPEEAASGSLSLSGNGMVFSGAVQPQYLPSGDDSNSRLVLSYKVCSTNLFGGCGKELLDWTQVPVTGSHFSVDVPGSVLRKGKKHKVWYKFTRTGSKYYSPNGAEQKTSAVDFNKR